MARYASNTQTTPHFAACPWSLLPTCMLFLPTVAPLESHIGPVDPRTLDVSVKCRGHLMDMLWAWAVSAPSFCMPVALRQLREADVLRECLDTSHTHGWSASTVPLWQTSFVTCFSLQLSVCSQKQYFLQRRMCADGLDLPRCLRVQMPLTILESLSEPFQGQAESAM